MSKQHKCNFWDHSLKESARISITRGNKFVCLCVHCRQQAPTAQAIKHSTQCCVMWRSLGVDQDV